VVIAEGHQGGEGEDRAARGFVGEGGSEGLEARGLAVLLERLLKGVEHLDELFWFEHAAGDLAEGLAEGDLLVLGEVAVGGGEQEGALDQAAEELVGGGGTGLLAEAGEQGGLLGDLLVEERTGAAGGLAGAHDPASIPRSLLRERMIALTSAVPTPKALPRLWRTKSSAGASSRSQRATSAAKPRTWRRAAGSVQLVARAAIMAPRPERSSCSE
jgi:hypothetical protein